MENNKSKALTPEMLGIECTYKFKSGEVIRSFKAALINAQLILLNHPQYEDKIFYDEFKQEIKYFGQSLADHHLADIVVFIAEWSGVNFTTATIYEAVNMVARKLKYHSLREKIKGLEWDGTPRINHFLSKHFGVKICVEEINPLLHNQDEIAKLQNANYERAQLIQAYSRKFFLSSMARILWATESNPVKVDTILVLYGEQGLGKSKALAALCFEAQDFSRTLLDIGSKDAILKIQGKHIYELCELAKRSKDAALEKAFFSEDLDIVRKPYQKLVSKLPRMCIFCATTNRMDILRDSTGSRRYWPIIVGEDRPVGWEIDIAEIEKERAQLWAEAYHILVGKKSQVSKDKSLQWWLSKDEEKYRKNDADLFSSVHPWLSKLTAYISEKQKEATKEKTKLYIDDADIIKVLEQVGVEFYRIRNTDKTTVEMLLTELGYRKKKATVREHGIKLRKICWIKK